MFGSEGKLGYILDYIEMLTIRIYFKANMIMIESIWTDEV